MCPTFLALCLALSPAKPRKALPRRRPAFRRPLLEALEERNLPSTFTVTNTLDDGSSGSLRWAITQANADTAPTSLINFNIAPSGVQTIQVGSSSALPGQPLPVLSHPATIDGTTEGGYNGSPLIVVNGSLAGTGAIGLNISAGSSTVKGLDINQFGGDGLLLAGNGDTVVGNYIGTDATGNVALGNRIGIDITGSGNTIGGTAAGARNLISGNRGDVSILGGQQNMVAGNYIGTNAAGTAELGGVVGIGGLSGTGVFLNNNANANTISGNVIDESISIDVLTNTGNQITGNLIGTNAAGTAVLTSPTGLPRHVGVRLNGTLGGNTIGGTTPAQRNVISGFLTGVSDVDVFPGSRLNGDTIEGNFIGTDAFGTKALPNTDGIVVGSSFLTTFAGNVISGNLRYGISFGDGQPNSQVVVQDNYIGTDVTGANALGNGSAGVFFGVYPSSNDTVSGNIIAYNGGDGVEVTGNYSVEISIRGNSIFANAGLGIDLGGTGVPVLNDSQGHGGPNWYQNFPVLTSAVTSGTSTVVSGTFGEASEPNFPQTFDFYANPAADPSGYGQGKTYLGSASVTTGANGNASFLVTFPTATTAGQVISATATDPNGNTSEFSADMTVQAGVIQTGESIALSGGTSPGTVQASLNGTALPTFTGSGPLYVVGSTGAPDTYTVNFGSTLTTPLYLFGNGVTQGPTVDRLIVNGDGSLTNVINKTPGQITWGSPVTETVYRSGIAKTTINANGTKTNYLNDPGSGTTINGGPGTNYITITATAGDGVVLNGGPNANNYVITMGNLLGPVTINSTAGTSTVTVYGPPGPNVLTLTPTQLTGAGQTINLNLGTTATSFTVDGSAGNDQLVLQGTPPGPLTAIHLAPTVGAITAPSAPVALTTAVSVSAPFTELDGSSVTAVWAWGDGTTSAGTVAQTGTSGTVSGSHTYAVDGVYTVTLTVANPNQQSGQSVFQYVVVYNPSAGFVTGGGWITSPAGAYAANPALTGKASFGFNAKYQSGSTVPTGSTQLQFPAANLTFVSTSYDWLVITTNQHQLRLAGDHHQPGPVPGLGHHQRGRQLRLPGDSSG
jgi:hypothetical protein